MAERKQRRLIMGVDLKKLYQWFDDNRDKIIEGHTGEYVLIHNNSVIGYYNTMLDAAISAKSKKLPENSFLIQNCLSKEKAAIRFFTNRVAFS